MTSATRTRTRQGCVVNTARMASIPYSILAVSLYLLSYRASATAHINLPINRPPCIYRGQYLVVQNFSNLIPPDCHLKWVSHRLLSNADSTMDGSSGPTLVAQHKYCFMDNQRVRSVTSKVALDCGSPRRRQHQLVTIQFRHPQIRAIDDEKRVRRSLTYQSGGSKLIRFGEPVYNVSVIEEEEPGKTILVVSAVHADHMPLYYTMIAPEVTKSAQMLAIDSRTGGITTRQKLDREVMSTHVLRVTATENGNPTHSTNVMVYVNVVDIQDHAPRFDKSEYTHTIAENEPIHTTVLHVYAHDEDAGVNKDVRYAIVDAEKFADFRLDPLTGQLQIARPLDRERQESYRFQVVATDQGDPPMNGTSIVRIEVSDVNDNYPKFTQSRYTIVVPENVTIPHRVATVKAVDADVGDAGRVRYSVVGGGDAFAVDYESGEVTLARRLNFKATPIHEVIIRAQDAGTPSLSNTTVLEVTVEDVNDNAPQFYTEIIQQVLEENVAKGTRVARAQAFDADVGDNALITYSIQIPNEDAKFPFSIDARNGWITTNRLLDREEYALVKFKVIATDHGIPPLSSSLDVQITVSDVNDNSPAFEHKFYNVTVSENEVVGAKIVKVKAVDPDESSTVSYSLVAGNKDDTFALLSMTDHALIRLNTALDFKKRNRYTLTVKATDDGQHTDAATVQIYVLDENSAPVFKQTPFTVTLSEATAVGETVAVLTAVDNDSGENSRITYSMEGDHGHFSIKETNGVVELTHALDRELVSTYNLRIQASDHGDPPLTAHTEIEVKVLDVNDNAPRFSEKVYQTAVSEDMNVGTSFIRITSTDPDQGDNGRVVYSLETLGNANRTFLIDATSGVIRLNEKLDRETKAKHELIVRATDHGQPPLSNVVSVIIKVDDVNDNSPRFASNIVHVYVAENSPIGTIVDRLHAVDPDEGPNAHVQYTVFGGPDMEKFELVKPAKLGAEIDGEEAENQGRLIVTRTELDFEQKNEFRFQVQASSGDLSSIADIVVHVTDVNDNQPVLEDFYVLITSAPLSPPSSPFARVPAYDPDLNATLTFTLMEPNDLVIVNTVTGELSLSSHMVTNRQMETETVVCVNDGINQACAKCTLIYIPIEDGLLASSVTLTLLDMTRDELLAPSRFTRLRDGIATLGPWHRRDVLIFSVEDNMLDDSVNVSFAVKHNRLDTYVSSEQVRELVHLNRAALAAILGVSIGPFKDNVCVREPCLNYEVCYNTLKHAPLSASEWYITDNFLIRPVHPVGTFSCRCPVGYTDDANARCSKAINMCYSSPCNVNATCVSTENDYHCVCPPDRTGKNCEIPLANPFCVPGICSGGAQCDARYGIIECKYCPYEKQDSNQFCQLHVRSFEGGSYAALSTIAQRSRFTLELKIATAKPDALLLYNGRYESGHDFIALRLVEGYPEFSYSLGDTKSGPTRLTMAKIKENKLDDGEWHTIRVEYDEKSVTLLVDDCQATLALNFSTQLDYAKCASRHNKQRTNSHYRFLDLTVSLYLGGAPSERVESDGITEFDGCIRELKIDDRLIDLADQALISNHGSVEGCKRRPNSCSKLPCQNGGVCMDKWLGHVCQCVPGYAGQNCEQPSGFIKQLHSDRSYVSWALPDVQPLNFSVGIPFRSRQLSTQILAVTFTGQRYVKIMVLDSLIAVQIDGRTFKTSFPVVSDGEWHDVQVVVDANRLYTVTDYIYTQHFFLESDVIYASVTGISVGAFNSTHAKPYNGCVKDVYFGGKREHLRVASHYHTNRGDCNSPNKCITSPGVCPSNAQCKQQWDQVDCKCPIGHTGSYCEPVCSHPVCENGGTCLPHSTQVYSCVCPKGYIGRNCHIRQPISDDSCPDGWWGSPVCGPCRCDIARGQSHVCNKKTGSCKCRDHHWLNPSTQQCRPCDCYYPAGASNESCNMLTGECNCRGDVQGRQCDRCADENMQIDSITGKCRAHYKHCPERYEAGLLWPATKYGATTTMSCPHGSAGTVIRNCDRMGHWQSANLHNCTSQAFEPLVQTLQQLDANHVQLDTAMGRRMALRLRNATQPDAQTSAMLLTQRLYGRDVYTGYRLVMALIRQQLDHANPAEAHVNDKRFTDDLVTSVGALLDNGTSEWWQAMQAQSITSTNGNNYAGGPLYRMVESMSSYGKQLASTHAHGYLRPFITSHWNLVFAIDDIELSDQRTSLPKFDRFVRPRYLNPIVDDLTFSVADNTGSVFYAIYPSLSFLQSSGCRDCISTPVVAIQTDQSSSVSRSKRQSSSDSQPTVTLTLPLYNRHNMTDPMCVRWQTESSSWSRTGCALSMMNETHVTCWCDEFGVFGVRMTAKLATYDMDYWLHLIACLLAIFLLLVGLVKVTLVESSKSAYRQIIHAAVLVSMTVNVIAYMLIRHARFNQVLCSGVSCVLHVSVLAIYGWLFVHVLHLYRSITDWNSSNQQTPPALAASTIIGCGIPAVLAAVTALMNRHSTYQDFCWIEMTDPYAWTMVIPVMLFLLLSVYIAITCYLVTINKEWDVFLAKLRLRGVLVSYALVHISCGAYIWLSWLAANIHITPYQQYLVDASLICAVIVLLCWVTVADKQNHLEQTRGAAGNLWMSSSQQKTPLGHLPDGARADQPLRADLDASPCIDEHLAPCQDDDDCSGERDPLGTYKSYGYSDHDPLNYASYCANLRQTVEQQQHEDVGSPMLIGQRVITSQSATPTQQQAPPTALRAAYFGCNNYQEYAMQQAQQSRVHEYCKSLQANKPDVIPPWDSQPLQHQTAAPLDSPDTQLSGGSNHTYAASSGYHSGMSSVSGCTIAYNRHQVVSTQASILSPVQKVLFTSDNQPMVVYGQPQDVHVLCPSPSVRSVSRQMESPAPTLTTFRTLDRNTPRLADESKL